MKRELTLIERCEALTTLWTSEVSIGSLPDQILMYYLVYKKGRRVSVIRSNRNQDRFGIWFDDGGLDLWSRDNSGEWGF